MVQSSSKRSDTPRTLLKIILMLGLALAGVAAIAAEPETTETASVCAQTSFDFGGRIIENGEVTDTWTLTCWRQPAQATEAPSAAVAATAKPVDALPVASQALRPADQVQGGAKF